MHAFIYGVYPHLSLPIKSMFLLPRISEKIVGFPSFFENLFGVLQIVFGLVTFHLFLQQLKGALASNAYHEAVTAETMNAMKNFNSSLPPAASSPILENCQWFTDNL